MSYDDGNATCTPGDSVLRLELPSRPSWLAPVRTLFTTLATRLGSDEVEANQVGMAVDEALCNVINHGYDRREDGLIEIQVHVSGSDEPTMHIVIEDRGRQVDPATIKPRPLEEIRPGGLGVHIIREIMDDVLYEQRDGGGMRLVMSKRLPGTAPATRPSVTSEGRDG